MPARPFIPVPNTVSIELFQTAYNQVLENYVWVRKDTPFTAADISSLRAAVVSWSVANWRLTQPPWISLNRIRTKAWDSASAPMEDYSLPTPSVGNNSGGGTNMPSAGCIAMKLSTGLTGRSNRGRIYIPVIGTGFLIGGLSTNMVYSGYMTILLNNWQALYTAIGAWNAAAHWVVVSFMTGGVWRAEGSVHNVVSLAFVDANLDNQRRRLQGRGI